MDTGGNTKTSPANTSLTAHDNNNEQAHINQHVTNNRTSETQTQRETTEIENDDKLNQDKNGHMDTDNIQTPIDKKQKTNNGNNDKHETQNSISENREEDWSTVQKKTRHNGQQDKQRQTNVVKSTGTNGIQEFTLTDIVGAIDQDKYAVPAFRGSLQISLTEGKNEPYNNENNYMLTVRKFFLLLQQLDPTVMIMAWDLSIKNDPITKVEELTTDKFEKFYSINRRLSDNDKRIDMTILIASAIKLHEVLKKGSPYKELQRKKWYVHLTERRYVGPQMAIGWLLEIHPVFTNVFTLKDEIVNQLQGISRHISLGQKTEKWKYNDERGRQQTTHVRVLCVQAPKELGPQLQIDLFEQWKNHRETKPQDNKSTMSGGMFIPYDVELYEMRMLLAKQEKFLKQYQYSVVLYKCRTLTKEFTVPAAVANILAIETGKTTTLQDLLLSMTVTNTSTKLVRSIERIDAKRFQLIVHKDNIEMCRLHMQNTLELLRNNVDNWHIITETEEGASLAPNGYTRAIMISPEKLQKKKTFLSNLAQNKQILKAPKSNYHHTWQAGEAWGSRGVRGGRGRQGRGRGSTQDKDQGIGDSKLILSTNQTQTNGGGYTVAKTTVEEKIERQFKLHAEARAKEDKIEQQLTKISGKYLNDLIEKDNRQEDMEFALETIQSNKGMETMFKNYISEAVAETTKAQTLAIAELEDKLATQSEESTAALKSIQEKIAHDSAEQYEYNDAAHNLFRAQFERLETAFQRNDTALKTEFQAMADHIQDNDQRRDKATMDMFNIMLQKMNEGNFTPINCDGKDDNDRKGKSNTIPFTDPTVTPVKQYTQPVNETSQTPIELDDSDDDKDNHKDIKESNETTITQEDIEAMEAVMQQSKEDSNTQIRDKSRPELQADIHATKNDSTTKLTTLKSKYRQSKEDSKKYRAHNTRSTRSKSGSDLGKGK